MLDHIIFQFVLIFAGAALFATLFLYLKQPIILAYIVLGIFLGPKGLGLIADAEQIEQLAHIGIVLLLFLIGLNFQPKKLGGLLGRIGIVTLATCFVFMLLSFTAALSLGYPLVDSLIIGAAFMFSSTIVSMKLIPTTQLHHHHVGEVMISVLLLQDVIAIMLIVLVTEGGMTTAMDYERPDWVDLPFEAARISSPTVYAAANSVEVRTGLWRTLRPVIDYDHCNRCWWVCSTFCPDGAIDVGEDGTPAIDYEHCKGCMICVAQCPPHAIEAVPEQQARQADDEQRLAPARGRCRGVCRPRQRGSTCRHRRLPRH